MSELDLLRAVADDLFREHCQPEAVTAAEATGWAPDLWAALEAAGLTQVGVPEAAGDGVAAGSGWPEAAVVLRAAGYWAAPVPLAETSVLAGWLAAEAGLAPPPGPLAMVIESDQSPVVFAGSRHVPQVAGMPSRVPWGRRTETLVVWAQHFETDRPHVGLVSRPAAWVKPGTNLAGEPRDDMDVTDATAEIVPAPAHIDARRLLGRAALARAVQMSGALMRVLELSVEYARLREQFGRPIGSFQVIQQSLALMAGEVYAAEAAVDTAVEAVDRAGDERAAWAEIAAARVRAGEAASRVAPVAHQIHGAIGFTDEHQLRHFTRRLWAWRDEDGTERFWAEELGRLAAEAGPDGYWPRLTRSPG